MGYDMYWRKKDASEAAARAAADEIWDRAVGAREEIPREEMGQLNMDRARKSGDFEAHESYDGRTDRYRRAQDAVMDASRARDEAEQSCFRLNVRGMARFADTMHELTWKDEPPLPAEQQEKVARFVAEHDRILAWHGMTDTPGIPARKFGSNDGWIVLPAECRAALAIYMAKLEEIGQDAMDNLIDNRIGNRGRWAQWLSYLSGAITHDGFEVN